MLTKVRLDFTLNFDPLHFEMHERHLPLFSHFLIVESDNAVTTAQRASETDTPDAKVKVPDTSHFSNVQVFCIV